MFERKQEIKFRKKNFSYTPIQYEFSHTKKNFFFGPKN